MNTTSHFTYIQVVGGGLINKSINTKMILGKWINRNWAVL